jgi:peptide-methionine (S)-S-oxide reductase
LAGEFKEELTRQDAFGKPIVTEITPAGAFYPAEAYHIDYYNTHGSQPYCSMIIRPKVEKIKKIFRDKIKGELDMI